MIAEQEGGSHTPNTFPELYQAFLRAFLAGSRPKHAMEFFHNIVSTGYSPPIEDLESLINGCLRQSDELHALQLFGTLRDYRLLPRASTYNIFVGFYLREHQPEKARKMFKEMEGRSIRPNQNTYLLFLLYFIDRADYSAADSIREYMRARRIHGDVRFYNGLLAGLAKKYAFVEIDALLEEMRRERIALNLDSYNILIKAYAEVNRQDRIQELFKEMREQDLSPNTKTFNQMIRGLSSILSPEQAKEILLQMSRLGLAFNSHTYAALIINLLKQDKVAEAIEMLFQVESKALPLPVESYGEILKYCSTKRLEAPIGLIWRQMRRFEIAPTQIIYSTLMRHYLMKRNYPMVDALLLEMRRKWNLKPNAFILSSLLNHYVETLDIQKVKALIRMAKEMDVEINSVMYNVIMKCFYLYSRYHQGGHISRVKGVTLPLLPSTPSSAAPLKDQEQEIDFDTTIDPRPIDIAAFRAQFEHLFELPFKPTVHIYNEMMLSFFVRERFQDMQECLGEMRKNDVAPNFTTFTFLIKANIFQGRMAEARILLLEMLRVGLKPTLLHCALFFHAYCRKLMTEEAESFLSEMESFFQIRPNHVFFGSLIYAYTRRREYPKVFATFERMERMGFLPDTETCNYVLISLLEINEFVEARKFFEKMLLRGIRRNTHTYSYLADGFLARHDDQSLLLILSDCIISGNRVDAYPFNQLLAYYFKRDLPHQIAQVLDLMNEYCVAYDVDTVYFISFTFQLFERGTSEMDPLQVLRIVKKALVDLLGDAIHLPPNIQDRMLAVLRDKGLQDDARAFEQFLADLPELQRLWTTIDPAVFSNLKDHIVLPRAILEDPAESSEAVRDRLEEVGKLGKGTAGSLVETLKGQYI